MHGLLLGLPQLDRDAEGRHREYATAITFPRFLGFAPSPEPSRRSVMRILAFDCAGAQCAATLMAEDIVLAEKRLEFERGHAQLLIPFLQALLAKPASLYPTSTASQ